MLFCGKCGAQNQDNDAFCGSCGTRLVQETKPQITPAQPVPPPWPQQGQQKAKGTSVFKKILYGVAAVFALFVCFVIYVMITDKDVKSDTKVQVQTASPSKQVEPAQQPQSPPAVQPNAQVNKPPASSPATTLAKVVAMDIGSGFDAGNYIVIGKADSFQAGRLDTVHAVIYLENVKSPITVKGEWVYLNSRESIFTNDISLSGDGRVHFELSKPNKGWPAGEFAIKIYVNGQELSFKKFRVY